MSGIVRIPAGNYEIGDDSIPNAGPRHHRKVAQPYWIDAIPVTWAHFEVFVTSGGYSRNDLWPFPSGTATVDSKIKVDDRCKAMLEAALPFREAFSQGQRVSRRQPVTAVTWFEAFAICRFFNARLAFEIEWEIAMTDRLPTARAGKGCGGSQTGSTCTNFVGMLQEWTCDAFTPRYWRSDEARSGSIWSDEAGVPCVSVRGSSPDDLYQHVCARTGADPRQGASHRGFRRVWDLPPQDEDVYANWRA